jgi:hypothetical protein
MIQCTRFTRLRRRDSRETEKPDSTTSKLADPNRKRRTHLRHCPSLTPGVSVFQRFGQKVPLSSKPA